MSYNGSDVGGKVTYVHAWNNTTLPATILYQSGYWCCISEIGRVNHDGECFVHTGLDKQGYIDNIVRFNTDDVDMWR